MTVLDSICPDNALRAITKSCIPHRERVHKFRLLLLSVMHRIAAVAVASPRKFRSAAIVTGEGVVNLLDDSAEKWIDHGDVVNHHGYKRFSYGPTAGLLGAVDGVLEGLACLQAVGVANHVGTYEEDKSTSKNATGHDKKSSAEHDQKQALPLLGELSLP
jgi:hypothetical protein